MTPHAAVQRILDRLDHVRSSSNGNWAARCPAHDDQRSSLSVANGDEGHALVHCFAGCPPEAIMRAIGLTLRDLFAPTEGGGRGGVLISPDNSATVQHPPAGLTLARYAGAKRLPLDFLRDLGLADMPSFVPPAIKIPYLDPDGTEAAVRFRLALGGGEGGDARFRWRKNSKPILYGLWRLSQARARGYVTLVEGESDTQTLWLHDEPALGLPGAAAWREEWAAHLDGIPVIYLVIEPDQGGAAVREWLASSSIRDRVRLVHLGEFKDVSGLYLAGPEQFPERWQAALAAAVPWVDVAAAAAAADRRAAWETCADLARCPRILDEFAQDLRRSGVVGEEAAAKLLYLAVTSRLLPRPVSVAVKGPSAGGKSFTTERVLAFFPEDAYYALSAMSERALAYSTEPLAHRFLVLYEAAGLSGDFASYLVRSLLSEGRLRYETVEKTPQGLRPRLIEREGPTGLIVTTTRIGLHPENETRLLSLTVTDTPDQTRAVLRALAGQDGEALSLERWHALQRWLQTGDHHVYIPYATTLAELVPPLSVRLRRDFGAVLTLIAAHALLHQATRERDGQGRVLATHEDYTVVRELVGDLLSESVGAAVKPEIIETVQAVGGAAASAPDGVSVTEIARRLGIDKSSASRRIDAARTAGYLRNLEERKGRPARLVLGDPLPEGRRAILPTAEALGAAAGCCTVAGGAGG